MRANEDREESELFVDVDEARDAAAAAAAAAKGRCPELPLEAVLIKEARALDKPMLPKEEKLLPRRLRLGRILVLRRRKRGPPVNWAER